MIIRVRRGLESNRSLIIPELGEPIFTTDTRMLYVGDGVTPGGIAVQSGGAPASPLVISVNGSTGIIVLNQDNIGDGATYKQYSQAEKTKLAGIIAGATANDTDANLKNRSNHTGLQPISTVTNLQAILDDKATANHNHNILYYAKSEVDSFLGSKSNVGHTHIKAAITDFAHTHPNTDVTGLGTASTRNVPALGDAAASEVVLGNDTRLITPFGAPVSKRYISPIESPNDVRVLFTLPDNYAAGSLEITLNGLTERFISETTANSFTFQDAPRSSDTVLASYTVQ